MQFLKASTGSRGSCLKSDELVFNSTSWENDNRNVGLERSELIRPLNLLLISQGIQGQNDYRHNTTKSLNYLSARCIMDDVGPRI